MTAALVGFSIDNFNLECAGDLKPYAKVADAHPIAAKSRLVLLDEQLVHRLNAVGGLFVLLG